MPTVPLYEKQVKEQALTGGFSQVPQGTGDAAMAIGKGLAGAGDAMFKVADRQATDEAFKIERQARLDWIETESRLRQQYNGDNVAQYESEVQKWWQEAPKRYGESVSPMARAKVGRSLGAFQVSAIGSAKNFAESERNKMLDFNYAKNQDSIVASTLAIVTPETATAVSEAGAKSIRDGVRQYAITKGVNDPVVIDQMVRERVGQLHAGVMQQIVDKDPAAARAYLTKFGDDMSASAKATADNLISTAERNQKVLMTVTEAVGSSESLTDALAKVREAFKSDPEGTKAAVAETKARFKELDDAQTEVREKAFERAWALAIDQRRGRAGVDAATWNAMGAKERDAIEDELYQRSERVRLANERAEKKANEGPVTDWDVYADLRQKGIDGKLSTNDIRREFPKLAAKEREALLDIASKKGETLKDAATLTQQISSTANSLDLDKKKKGLFEQAVFTEVERLQKEKNKPLEQEERQKVIDRMLIEGGGTKWYQDDDKPFYTVRGTPAEESFVPRDRAAREAWVEDIRLSDVPAGFQQGIKEEMRKRGAVATPQAIIKAYQAYILKGE
jgi:hypothetical protein